MNINVSTYPFEMLFNFLYLLVHVYIGTQYNTVSNLAKVLVFELNNSIS